MIHSNTIEIKIQNGQEYNLNLRRHPLYCWRRHYPDWRRPFRAIEFLLLLKQDKHFEDNTKRLEHIGKQIPE